MTDPQFPARGWRVQRKMRFVAVEYTRLFQKVGLDKACLRSETSEASVVTKDLVYTLSSTTGGVGAALAR